MMQYACQYVEDVNSNFSWSTVEAVTLRDVVTGNKPRLETRVRACWTREHLCIRFECEDDHIVATMEKHDDPIYLEDVVEVFLDESGLGETYFELEVSPLNVVFDARIQMDKTDCSIIADTSWDAQGLQTLVVKADERLYVYEILIPFSNFQQAPQAGTQWKWNLYRIDEDQQGQRHYWAWSPTGVVNYHIPKHFGSLVFCK
ncbi:hypothetical protein FHS15_005458 [Paenibacillus castaneae]|uniref:carbohydrate-binding family 9-like protein n=1 Tax=Paenibacillus castaneae TaxID=474957 RepID=UPI000C9A2F7D|nr:carbohydrate-binding family 9-like protein [Paenibacillus castaneae]NIK80274.1 hypothetical protein [Paenibacillus castaneae]